jgi:hypothetical protein
MRDIDIDSLEQVEAEEGNESGKLTLLVGTNGGLDKCMTFDFDTSCMGDCALSASAGAGKLSSSFAASYSSGTNWMHDLKAHVKTGCKNSTGHFPLSNMTDMSGLEGHFKIGAHFVASLEATVNLDRGGFQCTDGMFTLSDLNIHIQSGGKITQVDTHILTPTTPSHYSPFPPLTTHPTAFR